MAAPLLEVTGLVRHFPVGRGALRGTAGGVVHAVDGVDFALARGETLALVGESGCGKTTLGRTAALLYPPTAGRIRFDGVDVTGRRGAALKAVRRRIQLVFQDPYGSLNPRMPISAIIAEPLVIHRIGDAAGRRARVAEVAAAVGLDPGALDRYPHEFSGGQRQRIAIARALAPAPELIVADEPLSALDVSIQGQILALFRELRARFGLAYLFISHDLAVVGQLADRVAVMYLGRIVEIAPRRSLFAGPAHPYTRALVAAVPRLGRGKRRPGTAPRTAGEPPDPIAPPPGCRYHPRCPFAEEICRREAPALAPAPRRDAAHRAACHFPLAPSGDDGPPAPAGRLDRPAG